MVLKSGLNLDSQVYAPHLEQHPRMISHNLQKLRIQIGDQHNHPSSAFWERIEGSYYSKYTIKREIEVSYTLTYQHIYAYIANKERITLPFSLFSLPKSNWTTILSLICMRKILGLKALSCVLSVLFVAMCFWLNWHANMKLLSLMTWKASGQLKQENILFNSKLSTISVGHISTIWSRKNIEFNTHLVLMLAQPKQQQLVSWSWS